MVVVMVVVHGHFWISRSSGSILACRSSCAELSECVSYALQKLLMNDITLITEQCFAMEAIYNRQDVFVWLPTGYGRVCVIKFCHSSWTINTEW